MDTCTAYTAAVTLYGNGQRSGVITNLRISEFDLRQEEDENLVVIPCVHHKTGAQAMAQLAITTDIKDILMYYLKNIRSQIETNDIHKDNFFVAFNGGLYTQVYRKLKDGLSVGNLHPPPPSEYRVVISSEARRYLSDTERRTVVKHLSHTCLCKPAKNTTRS